MRLITTLKKRGNSSHFIPIDAPKAQQIIRTFGKRVLCVINDTTAIHSAIQKNKHIGYFIMIGKSTKAKINVKSGEAIVLHIEKDESKYQAEVPEVLEEFFAIDEEALAYFDALTSGKQRTIIHYISNAKRVETQINRTLKIIENLKFGITDLKELMQ